MENEGAEDVHHSADEIDEMRHKQVAYEYLCHLEEAKKWLEAVLKEPVPSCTELEENLRNGVILAKLGNLIVPNVVPYSRIFDAEQKRYNAAGLQFRHTDNINYWIKSLHAVQLPVTFHPETTDVYDKKNMPRVIYCVHALSTHLFKMGLAPQIHDLYGKVNFTDEEISAMSTELRRKGLKLPAFQKICGLLTGESSVLHSAITEINSVFDIQDFKTFANALCNPNAKLDHVLTEYIEAYRAALKTAKIAKLEALQNRSLSESYEIDVYDEMLSQVEIQGHIMAVNVQQKWNELISIASNRDCDVTSLTNILSSPCLELHEFQNENAEYYATEIKNMVNKQNWTEHKDFKKILQNIITVGNSKAAGIRQLREAVDQVNRELESGTVDTLFAVLHSPALKIDQQLLTEHAAPLYFEEMQADRQDSKSDLTYEDIVSSVRVLFHIAAISKAVDTGSVEATWEALSNPCSHVTGLEVSLKIQYWRALSACLQYKRFEWYHCPVLSYNNIQDCIDLVNYQHEENSQVINSLQELNQAVKDKNDAVVINILQRPVLKVADNISDCDATLIMKLLRERLHEQAEGAELWLEDVEAIVKEVQREVAQVQTALHWLSKMNTALQDDDRLKTIECLVSNEASECLSMSSNRDFSQCFSQLMEYKRSKEAKYSCPWITYSTHRGHTAYLNMNTLHYSWSEPQHFQESPYLSKSEIVILIQKFSNYQMKTETEKSVIKLQARCKGFLLRKKLYEKLQHYRDNEDKIILIQNWWRSRVICKKLEEQKLQKKRPRRSLLELLEKYRQEEHKIIKIQALWRARQTRRQLMSVLQHTKPPFKVVKLFLPHLQFTTEDYDRELQLQSLKEQVVQAIRHNNQLSQQIDKMDITIGLLVQNRISMEDVVAQGKCLNALAAGTVGGTMGKPSGLRALCASSHHQLKAYQHLFYLLQTRPHYLAKLIFCLPHSRTTNFVRAVILTLFNFGASKREEYLLLKLFQHALHEEVRCKFTKPSDAVMGNPLVIKIVVNYARQHSGQNSLQKLLGPLIQKVLCDKHISVDTNPVTIYGFWRNQMEMETGKASDLPVTVTQEEALSYEEVRKRLDSAIDKLKTITSMFLEEIIKSKDNIPYGLLFIAKELSTALSKKFPDCPEKEILKVVGNLIYYRYINAALVAPDAYDIVPLSADKKLGNEERHLLASIAKILQFAASKKGFGEECQHLTCLNPFLVECHEMFKNFFRSCCQVESLEKYFCMNEFSEAVQISRPTIFITIQEICDTHNLLLEYASELAPDLTDPLHEILDDLGPVPTVSQLMGYGAELDTNEQRRIGKAEVCLTLTNKFEVPDDLTTDLTKLFIKAKELLVALMPFLSGHTLPGALRMDPTSNQERTFEIQYQKNTMLKTLASNLNIEPPSYLRSWKACLRKYLSKLEEAELVDRADGYQSIVDAVVQDLCNKGKYRQIQAEELQTIKITKQRLDEKRNIYEECIEYYNQYIQKCLENLNRGKIAIHRPPKGDHPHKISNKKLCLKYTAAKLQEKGVLVTIDGLPAAQFKNVQFEISPADNNGVFTVKGKFMGVEVEKIDIDIQKLLQMQFEGVGIMDIFGKAKVNINLLLFLLNKKFYGKFK